MLKSCFHLVLWMTSGEMYVLTLNHPGFLNVFFHFHSRRCLNASSSWIEILLCCSSLTNFGRVWKLRFIIVAGPGEKYFGADFLHHVWLSWWEANDSKIWKLALIFCAQMPWGRCRSLFVLWPTNRPWFVPSSTRCNVGLLSWTTSCQASTTT